MDLSKLAPSDIAVTLRGLERRYRGLFAGIGEDESPDDVARRVVDGWSPIEHIVAAAWGIAAADRALAAILTEDDPVLDPDDVVPERRPKPGAVSGTLHERLAELGLEANAAADRVEATGAREWERTGTVAGEGRRLTAGRKSGSGELRGRQCLSGVPCPPAARGGAARAGRCLGRHR